MLEHIKNLFKWTYYGFIMLGKAEREKSTGHQDTRCLLKKPTVWHWTGSGSYIESPKAFLFLMDSSGKQWQWSDACKEPEQVFAEGRPAQKKTLANVTTVSPPLTTKPLHFSRFLSHSLQVTKMRNTAGCDTRCLLEPPLRPSRPASLFFRPRNSTASHQGSLSSPGPPRNEEQVCIQPQRISEGVSGGVKNFLRNSSS